MADSPNARPIQSAAPRGSYLKHTPANKDRTGNTLSERKRGRPTGSKNRPRALIPKEVAADLLGVVKQTLPPELYDEMRDAIRSGKNISTINEAKILMKLMGPPVWQRLIEEVQPPKQDAVIIDPDLRDEIGEMPSDEPSGFDKGLNERLKVLISLMQFVAKLEQNDESTDPTTKPILEIIARRGIDSGRVKFLIGVESGDVGGSPDGTGGAQSGVRTVSGELSERQVNVSDSQQGTSVRVLDPDSLGDYTEGGDEQEL